MTNTADFNMARRIASTLYREWTAEREADVAAHAEEGHIPHYCIHGTNQWVDYDNICGGCEDGVTILRMAVWAARDKVAEFHKRLDHMTQARIIGAPGYSDFTYATWVWEPIAKFYPPAK